MTWPCNIREHRGCYLLPGVDLSLVGITFVGELVFVAWLLVAGLNPLDLERR